MSDPTIIPAQQSRMRHALYGPHGLRAGWRLLVFIALFAVLSAASSPLDALVRQRTGLLLSPAGVIARESIFFADILIATLIMGAFERRTLGAYGLPGSRMFRKDFWAGAMWGFGMLSIIIALMAAVHSYSPGGLALSGVAILKFGSLWAMAFLIVGFAEEFTFRGYFQFTLTNGIGFWPAAAVTCVLFALVHRSNQGESWFGLANIVLIAVFLCLALRRTGSLWFAVGWHMAFDWGESFFYSVPDSGMTIVGHLLNPSLKGSKWLSGGTVGPEATVFDLLVTLGGILLLARLYPEAKYPAISAIDSRQASPANLHPAMPADDSQP